MNNGAGVDAWSLMRAKGLLPQTRQPGKIKIRVIGHDHRTANMGQCLKSRGHDDTACCTFSQLVLVLGTAQKSDLMRLCGLEWRQAFNGQIRRSGQSPTKTLNNRRECQRHSTESGKDDHLPTEALRALMTLSVMSCLG